MSAEQHGAPDTIAPHLAAARRGSSAALGEMLELCRPYLLLIANQELNAEVRAKVGASDVVQETFLEAQRDFARFDGAGESDLLAWLRRILLNNIANATRQYCQTEKRQVAREVPIEDLGGEIDQNFAVDPVSPQSLLVAREQDVGLRRALEQLPEPHRQVVQWRNYDRLPFEEIGRRLGRSAEATRKLWSRAIERLQELLESSHDSG